MSLIYPMKFKTWQTGHFKLPCLETPLFPTGDLSAVASGRHPPPEAYPGEKKV